jgi:CxxC motif-containing protein (DUF1111 family)
MKRFISAHATGLSFAGTLFAGAGAGVFGCGGSASTDDANVENTKEALLGAALPGIAADDFAEARDTFEDVESINDGVGPIFNERSCAGCHSNGAVGGAGENIERRFGRFVNGIFDPLANLGGTLRQLFSVGNFNNPNLPASSRGRCDPGNPTLCCVPREVDPPQATVRNVGRLTTPLFGLGLVDAMPDSFFDGLAAAQPAAIRGVVNRVLVVLPDPRDPTQVRGGRAVGRFGWKAGIRGLVQFSADAYSNEMAITTQSCVRGTSIIDFAVENAPNAPNGSVPAGCDDLAPLQPQANVNAGIPLTTDEAVGPCTGGRTEIQDDVAEFTTFMTFLAPPPRDFSDLASINRGDPLFTSTGCAGCHVRTTFRTPAAPFNGVPGNFAFNPYSDFLKHDMGTLGDMIGDAPPDDPAQGTGDTVATTRQMRTAPLWGLRFRNHLLHDGRAGDVATAVRAHDGQAAAARDAFNRLTAAQQHDLTQFVRSL